MSAKIECRPLEGRHCRDLDRTRRHSGIAGRKAGHRQYTRGGSAGDSKKETDRAKTTVLIVDRPQRSSERSRYLFRQRFSAAANTARSPPQAKHTLSCPQNGPSRPIPGSSPGFGGLTCSGFSFQDPPRQLSLQSHVSAPERLTPDPIATSCDTYRVVQLGSRRAPDSTESQQTRSADFWTQATFA